MRRLRDCYERARWLVTRRRGIVFSFSIVGALVAVAGALLTLGTSPALINAASAGPDPTPTVRMADWNDNPQEFADAARASVGEVWKILSSSPMRHEFPHIHVVATKKVTDCVLYDTSPRLFDPERDLAGFCKNGARVYLSQPKVLEYQQKFGAGRLLGYIVDLLAATREAGDRSDLPAFTACFAGAWVGYIEHYSLISLHLADGARAYFDEKRSFDQGRSSRSFRPCFA